MTDTFVTDDDLHLLAEGTHLRMYRRFGAHLAEKEGVSGAWFAVWAPNAVGVWVHGDFDAWEHPGIALEARGGGVWEGFVPGVSINQRYKYHVLARDGQRGDKADPLGICAEAPPATASVVRDLGFVWGDEAWLAERGAGQQPDQPMSIYEVHLGSWMRLPGEGNRSLSYREIAPRLAEHCTRLGFTHVELMPVMEHPFFGSWGYQITGFFAASRRYGDPQDLMFLIDALHRAGLGVILDWVPGHFPSDAHGLAYFDGTHLYEHADPRQGFHPEWKSLIFNFGRKEVKSFLLSSAMFWLEVFHADGLRIDGVASMLHLDYARNPGEWVPNIYGGRENLEAVEFLRHLNMAIRVEHPDCVTIAEDSTAWPQVTRRVEVGGLGFSSKWDMGWMHDILGYLAVDPIHRRYHHNKITFRSVYQYDESYVLPLSHDEVVHGKGSLANKMWGDAWQKRANLRLLFAVQWTWPGKKLFFMGNELGQWREWDHDGSLDWHLLGDEAHAGIGQWVADLNRAYRSEPALHEGDHQRFGFDWVDGADVDNSVITFLRRPADPDGDVVLVAFNFTPIIRYDYYIGVPRGGFWTELLCSDAPTYGGSGVGNQGGVIADDVVWHGRPAKLRVTLPPLGAVIFVHRGAKAVSTPDP